MALAWFHWARNSCPPEPPARVEVQASVLPSGEGTGRLSNPGE